MPSVASSILNHAIARFEKNLSPVIQFEDHFAGDNHVEVYCIGGVHTWMVPFQGVE